MQKGPPALGTPASTVSTSRPLPRNAQGAWSRQGWGAGYACPHPTAKPSSGHWDSVPLLVLFSELFPATPSPADQCHLGPAQPLPAHASKLLDGVDSHHLPELVEIARFWAMGHARGRLQSPLTGL